MANQPSLHLSVFQNKQVSELTVDDGVKPVKYPHIRVADKFM